MNSKTLQNKERKEGYSEGKEEDVLETRITFLKKIYKNEKKKEKR